MERNIHIGAPAERVWSAVVDFPARPRWSPRVKSAELLDGGPLREGTRIRLKVGGNQFTPRVQAMRPRERLELLVRGPGFSAAHTYQLAPATNGTLLTINGAFRGVFGRLMVVLMPGSVRRDLDDELDAIKRAAEAPAP